MSFQIGPLRRSARIAAVNGFQFMDFSMDAQAEVRFDTPEKAAAHSASWNEDLQTFHNAHMRNFLHQYEGHVAASARPPQLPPTGAAAEPAAPSHAAVLLNAFAPLSGTVEDLAKGDDDALAFLEERAIRRAAGDGVSAPLAPAPEIRAQIPAPANGQPAPCVTETEDGEIVEGRSREHVDLEDLEEGEVAEAAEGTSQRSGKRPKLDQAGVEWRRTHVGSNSLAGGIRPHGIGPQPTSSHKPLQSNSMDADAGSFQRSRRKGRRKKAKGNVVQIRRGGWHRTLADDDQYLAQLIRLLVRTLRMSDAFQSVAFDAATGSSAASTGWMGKIMPKRDLETLRRLWASGELDEATEAFFRIPYNGKPTILLDASGRCFVFRTSQINFLLQPDAQRAFQIAVETLLRPTMVSIVIMLRNALNARGPHIACIMGYHKQYLPSPVLEKWHKDNMDAVNYFIDDPIIQSVIKFVSKTVKVVFPGVVERFERSANWHFHNSGGIRPHFGCFWNLCINALFQGQKRIHCQPHIDWKNIVGICVLIVYQVYKSKPFNHKRKSWLVLWEAGVVIQLPPWVFMAYPSSLLHHWNRDMSDLQIVVTDGERPTPENSTPLEEEGDGRATFVFFNQASMFQSSETGYDTLKEARAAGWSGNADFGETLQEGFTNLAQIYDMDPDK